MFGLVVKELVVAVTDDPSIEDPGQRRPGTQGARALDGGERSRLIYAADRLDGIRQMTAMVVLEGPSPAPAAVRAASWREDIEMLRERGIPAALLGNSSAPSTSWMPQLALRTWLRLRSRTPPIS